MAKPVLPVLVLEDDQTTLSVHEHLLCTLGEHFTVQLLTTPEAVQEAVADCAVRAVLVNDSQAAKVVQPLLARGGTVVVAGEFSGCTGSTAFSDTFKNWGLPWGYGAYYRTDHFPTVAAIQLGSCSSTKLPACYNVKAGLLEGMRPEHRLYTPSSVSATQSMVWAPRPADTQLAAAALAPSGLGGWVAYVGDVNGEEHTSAIVLAIVRQAHSRQ